MKENKTIYDLAVEKMDSKDINNHCSDLYLRKTDISTALVNDYEFKNQVSTFKDLVDHVLWYEIPFAYYPYFTKEGRR